MMPTCNPVDLWGAPITSPEPGALCSPSAVSPHQRAVVTYLKANHTITSAQATALIGRHIYANAEKHVGATLSRMVDRGLIVRVKRGHFRLP